MNVITEYNDSKARLFAHFKYDGIDFGIEDSTGAYWKVDGREVMWCDVMKNGMKIVPQITQKKYVVFIMPMI